MSDDLIEKIEEMLRPANIPVQVQREGHEDALEERMVNDMPPMRAWVFMASESPAAVGRPPDDCGSLCADCPNPGGCPDVCQIEVRERRGDG